MKNKYYHGTTLNNYNKMIASNFKGDKDCTWYCSDDTNLYLYDLTKLINNKEVEDEEGAIRCAFESALITAAVHNPISTSLVVIEFELNSELIEDDYSARNMADMASCIELNLLTVNAIKNVYISKNAYLPSLRLLYIKDLINNGSELLNTDYFNEVELNMLEALKNVDIPETYELFHNFEWGLKLD